MYRGREEIEKPPDKEPKDKMTDMIRGGDSKML